MGKFREEQKRIFVGISVEPTMQLVRVVEHLKIEFENELIRWEDFRKMHFTLKFFGDTDVSKIPKISEALQNSALINTPSQLDLQGINVFDNIRNPRVLWIGVKNNKQILQLHQDIKENLKGIGYKPDAYTYYPHLTIGRIKRFDNKAKLKKLIKHYSNFEIQKTKVSEFYLYESILGQKGAVYNVLESYKLGR